MNGRQLAERAQELAEEVEAVDLAGQDTEGLAYLRTQALASIALSLAVIAEKVRTS